MVATQPSAPRHTRSAIAAGVLGLAGLLAFLEAVQVFFDMPLLGYQPTWREAVLRTLPSWIILAALIAPAAMLVRRFPLDRRTLHVGIPIHVCAAALFTVLHLGGTAIIGEQLFRPIGIVRQFTSLATAYFTVDVLTYVAIVGVIQLVRVYRAEAQQERAAAELSASLSQMRFHALRNQLDPHFIFNALNAINALALRGERVQVVESVGSLAALLRESLRETAPQLVPLSIELQYVSHYVALQTLRFPNRLQVRTDVSQDAGAALVPALTVHTIVEEAVASRLRGRHPCTLELSGARHDNALHVDVMLDGPAHDDESELDTPIRALDVRLRQLYGAEYGLTRDRTAGRTAIRLRLPALFPATARA